MIGAAVLAAWAVLAPAPRLGSPTVDAVLPRGAQRGTELDVTFFGQRLADAASLLMYEPGIEVVAISAPDEQRAIARLRLAPDCPLGEHRLRLVTRTGIAELRTFWVGPFPVVDEIEPNHDVRNVAALPAIPCNSTVHGVVTNEDVDAFVVEMKAGERLIAEVEGMRLAETLFDPFVAILDERRFELASSDDSSLFRQDPVASCVVPADGRYVVVVRESSYGGNDRCRYRLHLGSFPRPLVATPGGVKPGSDVVLTLLGDVGGPIEWPLHVPESAEGEFQVVPEQIRDPTGAS